MADGGGMTSGAPTVGPVLSDAEFEMFRRLIYDAAGIAMAPSKKALIAGRLAKRVRDLGYGSFKDYFAWINGTKNDPDALPNRPTCRDSAPWPGRSRWS